MDHSLKPLMLSTQELLMTYWPQVEPLLAECPVTEEFSTEDIRQSVLAGQMFIFAVIKDETEVEMVLVLTATPSKTLPVMTIVSVAGRNLRKNCRLFWDHFKGWCYMNGARAIDAYVPERMEEFLGKELGLKKETVHVRLRL